MESRNSHEPLILTKREFLQGFASVSGISAVLAALDAWDMSIASAATAPPVLSGRADGTRVLILGAGIAGMTTAWELTERGYDCRILEARSFAGAAARRPGAGSGLTRPEAIPKFAISMKGSGSIPPPGAYRRTTSRCSTTAAGSASPCRP